MVQSFPTNGRKHYGPGSSRQRPHDGGSPNAGINSPNTMNDQLGQSPDRTNPTANNPAVNPTINTR
jgi:hypothetical protein